MDPIYGNTDFVDLSINEASYCKGNPTGVHQKRDVTQSKCTKVLLLDLCVSVVLAFGGLCVLGVLYNNNLGDFESLHVQHQRALMQLSAQEINATTMESELHEIKAKNNKLRASLYNAQSGDLSVDGWTVWRRMIYFSTDKRDWAGSRAVCVSMGADLVTITSQKEQDFLVSKIKESHWIGLNDLETEGRWVWVNNKTLEETGVKFWHMRTFGRSEPDNWKVKDPSGENCASLGDINGDVDTWYDSSCKEQKRFICEKK
ncbi:C-type lectin domain family 4 member D-like [Paramisgurnus dabryanus]|uniref:C-type lectin domain family 4 member D-like n=1 Tax=Paramisgurnus dabryanus TaxID=90735 RepID=UPI0031F403C2